MVYPRTDGSRSLIKFAALCALNSLVFRGTGAAANDTCSLTVSDGDAAVGVQINTDATCSSGGLGCINDICRFCKVRDTFQSSHFFTCDSVGTDNPTTVFPVTSSTGSSATEDSTCGISDGDLAVGIRAITDTGCSAGGLGCYSDHCRYCKVKETPQSASYGDCSSYTSTAASGSSASKTQSSASSAASSTGSSSATEASVDGSAPSSAAASSPQSSTSSTASSTTSSAPSDTADTPTDAPVVASNTQSSPSSAASSTTSSAPSDTTDAPTDAPSVASNPQSSTSSAVSSTAASAPSDATDAPDDNVETSAPTDATSDTTAAPTDNVDDSTDSSWGDSGSFDESADNNFGSDTDASADVADPTTAPVETSAPATEAPTTTATVVSAADFSWAPVDTPAPATETPAVTVSAADYTWVPVVTTVTPVETQAAGVAFVQAAARDDESSDAFAKMMKNDTFKWSVTGCAMVGVAAVVGVLVFAVKRVAGRTSNGRGAIESESVEQTVTMEVASESGKFNNTPCEDV